MRLRPYGERSFNSTERFLILFAVAALFYMFRLGSTSLGASEAYSALAASQSSFRAVIQQALRFDPGKPPLYQVLLHCFIGLFGTSEMSLRGFSALFALIALLPLYSLGISMFGPETALAAVAIWAVNPISLFLGQWARMYSLFIATVLMSMLSFWQLREQVSVRRIAVFAVCTALLLYTHLCGLLFVGVEIAVLIRDFYRGRPVKGPCAGLAIAFALFIPFLPWEARQARALLLGHWLDWIGIAHFSWSLSSTVTSLLAAAVMLAIVFGPQFETDEREPIWFCALWLITPILVLNVISIIVRPVFAIRYVAPAIPALALLVAHGVEVFGARVRNLATVGIAMAFAVLFFFCKAALYEPWADIARQVASASSAQAVFFESPLGLIDTQRYAAADEKSDTDFPQGYLKVPFDYYFKGANPRRVINPFDPARTRRELSSAALYAGGVWLISGSSDLRATAEMPQSIRFQITKVLHTGDTSLYHLVAVSPREFRNQRSVGSNSSRTSLAAR